MTHGRQTLPVIVVSVSDGFGVISLSVCSSI